MRGGGGSLGRNVVGCDIRVVFDAMVTTYTGALPGYDDLTWFMQDQQAIEAGGVIGLSNGAAFVSQWFADHPEERVRFALIEPFSYTVEIPRPYCGLPYSWDNTYTVELSDPRVVESQKSRAVAYFAFGTCAGGGHCEHADAAPRVIKALFP